MEALHAIRVAVLAFLHPSSAPCSDANAAHPRHVQGWHEPSPVPSTPVAGSVPGVLRAPARSQAPSGLDLTICHYNRPRRGGSVGWLLGRPMRPGVGMDGAEVPGEQDRLGGLLTDLYELN